VVFSASWCGPCHALIPKLKKVNTELKDRLAMTYVSLDEENTVKNWTQLMQKESIPWRSLLAKNDIEKIKKKYFVLTIPHAILVYPRGLKAEILDIRLDKDYKKLTKLVK
jgi:thiol-disulfide isomerase/thioredoxin